MLQEASIKFGQYSSRRWKKYCHRALSAQDRAVNSACIHTAQWNHSSGTHDYISARTWKSGKVKRKTLPAPGCDSTQIRPP
jgi:hypothetical protein